MAYSNDGEIDICDHDVLDYDYDEEEIEELRNRTCIIEDFYNRQEEERKQRKMEDDNSSTRRETVIVMASNAEATKNPKRQNGIKKNDDIHIEEAMHGSSNSNENGQTKSKISNSTNEKDEYSDEDAEYNMSLFLRKRTKRVCKVDHEEKSLLEPDPEKDVDMDKDSHAITYTAKDDKVDSFLESTMFSEAGTNGNLVLPFNQGTDDDGSKNEMPKLVAIHPTRIERRSRSGSTESYGAPPKLDCYA